MLNDYYKKKKKRNQRISKADVLRQSAKRTFPQRQEDQVEAMKQDEQLIIDNDLKKRHQSQMDPRALDSLNRSGEYINAGRNNLGITGDDAHTGIGGADGSPISDDDHCD